jgi:hypothetical protein
MKFIVVIFLALLICNYCHSQDSLSRNKIQTVIKDFYTDSFNVKEYNKLPKFLRQFMDEKVDGKFRLSRRFNATDIGTARFSRKLMYVAGSKKAYILGYEHGGRGYHCHAILFNTNGKEVINFYNLVTKKHQLSELADIIVNDSYIIQKHNDF